MVERLNRTLLSMLATTTRDHSFDWEDQIRKVCIAYNTSIHSSTDYTPFYLMFGHQARLPIDPVYGTGDHRESPPDNYAIQMKNGLTEAYSLVRKKLERTYELHKENYDRKVHREPYKEGDLVWMPSQSWPGVGQGCIMLGRDPLRLSRSCPTVITASRDSMEGSSYT